MKRIVASVSLTAGGAAAAAFLSAGIAAAAPDYNVFGLITSGDFTPSAQTINPGDNTAYGLQSFDFDAAKVAPFLSNFFDKYGLDDYFGDAKTAGQLNDMDVVNKIWLTFNPASPMFGEQQILLPGVAGTDITGGVIDIHNWSPFPGVPFGYVYVDLVGAGDIGANNDAVGTWLLTPFGTFDVSWLEDGSVFGAPYLESQLFDFSDFNPGDFSPMI